jgi:hypothetical protein
MGSSMSAFVARMVGDAYPDADSVLVEQAATRDDGLYWCRVEVVLPEQLIHIDMTFTARDAGPAGG